MDTAQFDRLLQALYAAVSRRGIARRLAALPLAVGLATRLEAEDAIAARRRDGAEAERKKKRKKKKKKKRRPPPPVPPPAPPPPPCSAANPCPAGSLCDGGVCQPCDVCPSGCAFNSLQALAAAASGAVVRVCPGVYSGNVTIDRDLTLIGAGVAGDPAETIILGTTDNTPVVSVTNQSQSVTLQRLRIVGGSGNNGDGVRHLGDTLTLTNCTLSDNDGDGIGNGAGRTAFLIGCTVSANRFGGIANNGTMTLTNCSVTGNSNAVSGGGIFNGAGTLNLAASSVTGNTTESSSGGGVFNTFGATVNLSNGSSVSGNTPDNCAGTGTYNDPEGACAEP